LDWIVAAKGLDVTLTPSVASATASARGAIPAAPSENGPAHAATWSPAFDPPHSTVNIFPKPTKSAGWRRPASRRRSREMASVAELSGYALELLRVGGGFALYRGRQLGSDASILVSAPARDPQTPADQRRLEHEYELAGDLDPAWAARPLSIERRDGRTMLVLEDAGAISWSGCSGGRSS
jgi:hypothetical protein